MKTRRAGKPKPPSPAKPDTVKFPALLRPLFEPYRYKVMWGGRGGSKSWSVARALLVQGMQDPLRILCAREVMRTIADSVHRLLKDQIEAVPEFRAWYMVRESSITGVNGAEFIYAGLRSIDADKIKSYEGVDIAWVEEGQVLSKRSLDILIPTIRADRSEIWITMNPELDTDEVYLRFIAHTPPPRSWVQKIGWQNNPWFPKVLEEERQTAFARDPVDYGHVWDGKPRMVVEGAIYANEVVKMIEDRRVRNVPYDPGRPVHTIWDLGWNDQTSIILVQVLRSEVSIIGYLEDSFRTYADWVAELQQLRYVWGTDWLPHDGANKDQKTGKSGKEWLLKLGRTKVELMPRLDVEAGIKAVRMMFPRVYADEEKAARLMLCLKRYRRGIPESTGEPGAPVHDEYSHGADAFRGLALIVDKIRNERERPRPSGQGYAPLDAGIAM